MDKSVDAQELLERIHALEARLARQTRRSALAGLVLASMLLIGAASDVSDVVRARSFVLLDDEGRECGWWRASTPPSGGLGHPTLAFVSENGARVLLSGGEAPFLLMNGGGDLQRDGRLGHAQLGVSPEKGPVLQFWGQKRDEQGSHSYDLDLGTSWGDGGRLLTVEEDDRVLLSLP